MNTHVPGAASDQAGTGVARSELERSDLDALRRLLLTDDRQQTQNLQHEIEMLRQNALLDEDFEDRLTDALTGALTQAQSRDPKAMARALAPAVVKSIRREITNSRDDMVEALYPITGRLVSAAVRDAIRKLASDINRRVDTATSPQFLWAKARSIVSRRPVSDFLIAGDGSGHVASVLIMDKATGHVLREWLPDDADQSAQEATAAPRTALYSALASFAENHGSGADSQLRQIDLNGHQVMLHHTARKTLVAEFEGTLSKAQVQAFKHDGAWLDEAAASDVTALDYRPQLLDAGKEPKSKTRGRIVLFVLLATLAGLAGWHIYERVMFQRDLATIRTYLVQTANLEAYPITVRGDRSSASARIEGLLPVGSSLSADDILPEMTRVRTIDLVTRPIADDAAIVALAESLDDRAAQAAALERRLIELDAGIAGNLNGITALQTQAARTEQTLDGNATALAGINETLTGLDARLATLDGQTPVIEANRQTLDDLGRRIETVSGALTGLAGATENRSQELRQQLAGLQGDLTRLRSDIDAFERATQADAEQRARALTGFIDGQELQFDVVDDFIDPALAHAALTRIADAAIATGATITVFGFGDDVGTQERNLEVSTARAQRVAAILERLGVDTSQLQIRGMGAQSFEGREPERRVILRVSE